MKLQGSDFKSQVFGAEKEMDFSIDTSSSIIFDILRDKMYTDKIAAVCREVASNSRDANVEAGRGDVPVRISIVEPNELESISDQSIVFEDCGLGITPSRMETIFLKYAASTKRDTNNQVGGFGLGAKTPFAYSDTFTVITVCDYEDKRMKFIYTAMIDSSKRGKMVLFDSMETDESTGTKIVVPISTADRYRFENEVFRSTTFWSVKPELSGFKHKFEEPETLHYDLPLHIVKDNNHNWNQQFLVVLEGIPYPVNTTLFVRQVSPKFKKVLEDGIDSRYKLLLHFRTGELTVSANREGLDYTEDTVKKIALRIEESLLMLENLGKKRFEEGSYLEGCVAYTELVR